MEDNSQYYLIIKNLIIKEITSNLTICRKDNDLEHFRKIEIDNFIDENICKIIKVINDIINDYEDGELKNPEKNLSQYCIREHLDEEIDTTEYLK